MVSKDVGWNNYNLKKRRGFVQIQPRDHPRSANSKVIKTDPRAELTLFCSSSDVGAAEFMEIMEIMEIMWLLGGRGRMRGVRLSHWASTRRGHWTRGRARNRGDATTHDARTRRALRTTEMSESRREGKCDRVPVEGGGGDCSCQVCPSLRI